MESEQNKNPEQGKNKKRKRSGRAANIDAIITSATEAARSHRHTDTWSNQGTNISYEGPTAPGAGGSVGTGLASGQDATGAHIYTDDAYQHAAAGRDKKEERSNP